MLSQPKTTLLSMTALLAFGLILSKIVTGGTLSLQRFPDDHKISDTWKSRKIVLAHDVKQPLQPTVVYTIVNASQTEIEISRREFDDLEYAYFEHKGKKFLLTGFSGGGSSDANFYQLHLLGVNSAEPVAASESYDSTAQSDSCLDELKKVEQGKQIFQFSNCGAPMIVDDELIFETPGWHCGFLAEGGCPHRDVVSLR